MLKLNHLTGFGSGAAAAGVTSYSYTFSAEKQGGMFYGGLTIPDHADWDLIADTTNYTIDFWVKHSNLSAVQENYIHQVEDANNWWRLEHVGGTGIQFRAQTGGSFIINHTFASSEIADTDWHHIALVKTSTTYELFIDGATTDTVVDASTDSYSGILEIGKSGTAPNVVEGYMDEIRISNSARWSSDFSASLPTTQHTSDANTLLLIHGGEAYTAPLTGETTQSCVALDGTGDYLTVPDHADWDFGSGDWTVDFWVYWNDTTTASSQFFFSQNVDGSNETIFHLLSSGTALAFQTKNTAQGVIAEYQVSWTPNTKQWYHIACVRSGTSIDFYIDGTALSLTESTAIASKTMPTHAQDLFIGCNSPSPGHYVDGYIGEYRISDTARWTANFTPPIERYTSDANTVLLIHGDEFFTGNWASGSTGSGATFTDSGNTGHTVTEVGNAISARGGTFTDSGNTGHTVTESGIAQRVTDAEYKLATDGVGYRMDGTGDYLQVPDHADWDFPSGDFTVEMFFRVDTPHPPLDMILYNQWASSTDYIKLWFAAEGDLHWYLVEGGSSIFFISTSRVVLTANVWHHIAIVRNGDDYFMWVDGVDKVISGSPESHTPATLAGDVYIGAHAGSGSFVRGNIDEVRISDIARYTTTFTPTTTQFVSDANTLLLIHGGEAKSGTTGSGATFTDSGNTGHTVTENGNAIESTGNFYKF